MSGSLSFAAGVRDFGVDRERDLRQAGERGPPVLRLCFAGQTGRLGEGFITKRRSSGSSIPDGLRSERRRLPVRIPSSARAVLGTGSLRLGGPSGVAWRS